MRCACQRTVCASHPCRPPAACQRATSFQGKCFCDPTTTTMKKAALARNFSPKARHQVNMQDARRLPQPMQAAFDWCEDRHLALRTPRPATEPRNGPTRNFHAKYRKNTPRAEILEPQENPPKYPQNTPNGYFWYSEGIFLVFSGYFGGKFWGSGISGLGVFFRYFSWKLRVGPSRGSVAGRGILKSGDTPGLGIKRICAKSLMSTHAHEDTSISD